MEWKFRYSIRKFYEQSLSSSTDQGEITEDIAKILGISSYSYLFRYICQLQESIRLNPKTDKAEKYEKELRRVLWIWCELTHTITWGQTTQMTQVTQE